ncbi:Na+-transporting NADH:ubiquinone oxidoreductase subunit A [Desulfocicer vacuolatum DSM 3385]|uniref:Na+-transporting NADH:ubiquinone oxidoreductase subunit A n=1 Tax=Desulfocicer vacuolatum DSM 3385 TaxID=1121400 RepID=A0A1W2ESK3_9BACT|nr:4Fe-4S dicluster domain-containing protein [Desulfocicer vacuolatum]SMD12631.1 Na+-transporting NADH:ubiquinone oxidoreductase subunit A [Desulfocicer vacuolatum DSM 3385]
MKRLKKVKTFHSKFNGVPETKVTPLDAPKTVALVPAAAPFVKLKLLVRENDVVDVGTPLLQNKRDPEIVFVSPGTGIVETIVRGPRRVVQEVVIRLDREAKKPETLSPVSRKELDLMSREKLIQLLKQHGIWPLIRQFPYMDFPDCQSTFPMVAVSLHNGDPFAPDPSVFLKGQRTFFSHGLAILQKLSKKVIVATPQRFLSPLKEMGLEKQISHVTQDQYPAGDPGVLLYQIKKSAADNNSCTMEIQEVIAMGHLFSTGKYLTTRFFGVGGAPEKTPAHYHSHVGCPVRHLVGDIKPGNKVITGGIFTGSLTPLYAHMGTGMSSAMVLDATDKDAFFGFVWPGRKLLSESRTFVSSLGSAPLDMDANLHGEERACINCGWCHEKCPVDLLPQFIMKAMGAGEMEEVLELGGLDCTGCGLCTFVCPSKIDVAAMMSLAKATCYRERVMP